MYDIIFLVEYALGNTAEMLYAVEYALSLNLRTGILLEKVSKSFTDYLVQCYGNDVILTNQKGLKTKHLIHSFVFHEEIKIQYEFYFYIQADANSSKQKSETQLYLTLVEALYPGGIKTNILTRFVEDYSEKVRNSQPEGKTILYTGSYSFTSCKRWPHFQKLIELLGEENVMILGSQIDIEYRYSYNYPKWITKLIPVFLTNRLQFWKFLKTLHILKPYAHYRSLETKSYTYINVFSFAELVSIFKRSIGFIGNDGGLMQFAAAAGAKGLALFGPSSVEKNIPLNSHIKALHTSFDCQPCQFNVKGVSMNKYFISCPYQMRCMDSLSPDWVYKNYLDLLNEKRN